MLAVLEEIGLTKGERKIYLALLELGATSVGKIIKHSKISGSKTYEVLDRLIAKGLVNYSTKGKVKYFEAAPPERILDYIQEKEMKLQETKQHAQAILPELQAKQAAAQHQNDAKVYIGLKGLKTAYIEAKKDGKKGGTIYGMFIPPVSEPLLSFFPAWISDFCKRYKVKDLMLFNERVPEIDLVKNIPGVEVRIIPKAMRSPTEITIIEQNVIISTTGGDQYFTTVIRNKEVAASFTEYFHSLWEISKKVANS
ncbi:MAG: hypothetical protein OXR66_04690 [Candidatus Woesearchaeota archaeon]|nr:hypothetical protein [Candidatus Woesearchaeota archaeon]